MGNEQFEQLQPPFNQEQYIPPLTPSPKKRTWRKAFLIILLCIALSPCCLCCTYMSTQLWVPFLPGMSCYSIDPTDPCNTGYITVTNDLNQSVNVQACDYTSTIKCYDHQILLRPKDYTDFFPTDPLEDLSNRWIVVTNTDSKQLGCIQIVTGSFRSSNYGNVSTMKACPS